MFHNSSVRRRTLARVGIGIGATVAAILALPGIAQAHVLSSPEPPKVAALGGRVPVPNERDDASTTQVRVTLPTDQPIGSVQTTPVGWKVTTAIVNSTSPSRCSASSWTPSSRGHLDRH